MAKPVVLLILDGWGHSPKSRHNPLAESKIPTLNSLLADHPCTLLEASGTAVGLPAGQIGNSEVGHLHIGAGRKVPQDLTRINEAIATGDLQHNSVLLPAIQRAKSEHKTIHLIGLVSSGGVHSVDKHFAAMIKLIDQQGAESILHAFLDGRDTPPQSAKPCLAELQQLYQTLGKGNIASVCGRYYAMDRDQRWERTKQAYALLTGAAADYQAQDALSALDQAYARGETDEFVRPTLIDSPNPITDGDLVIFMNFRADRARQLALALTDPNFAGFSRRATPAIELITLTAYQQELNARAAFPAIELANTLGEYVAKAGLHQLRLAETEKYAHVTYFLNGGREAPFTNEHRDLIASPQVATYDLQPEMSAYTLTDRLVKAIKSQTYDLIVCNYANPDMVGHTGNRAAAIAAMAAVDDCVSQVLTALQQSGGEALISADHGNIEQIFDETNQQPHTAHTINPVPLIYVGRPAQFIAQPNQALDDIAPTLLHILGLTPPAEMTGRNLLRFS